MKWRQTMKGIILASLGAFAIGTVPSAIAQTDEQPPTARYAAGDDVDLALIITEWKGLMPNIPVFSCICQADSCDHSERWPFRNYDRYQQTVSLGDFNRDYTESLGFNCFNIETEKRDNQAPEMPTEITESELPKDDNTLDSLTASVSDDNTGLILTWPDAQTNTIDVRSWKVTLLDALDCETATLVPEKIVNARRIVGTPMVDPLTDNVAVPVLLEDCFDSQQTAVFVVNSEGAETYALYRVQVPGEREFPNEFSSYGLNEIGGLRYWNSTLIVRHGSASGAEALLVFRPDITPAGRFVSCGLLNIREGADRLCPSD